MKPTVVLKSFEALPSLEALSTKPTPAPTVSEAANELPATPRLSSGYRHILVPVDDSAASTQILAWGVALAEQLGALVSLLHVADPGSFQNDLNSGPAAQTEADVKRATSRHLVRLAREQIPSGRRGGTLLRAGKVGQQILAATGEVQADFLVVSTGSHAGMQSLLSGRTVERVVRHAPCPTFVAPLPALSRWQSAAAASPCALWRRVFVPVDLSDDSVRLLRFAAALAGPMEAEVRLFYVPGLYGNDPGIGHGHRNPFRTEVREAVEQRLWSWAKQHVPASLAVSALEETGMSGADVLALVAEREHCDLVVVGSSPVSWWHRVVDGSVAEGLVRLGRSLVLVVPQPKPCEGQCECGENQEPEVKPALS